MSGNSDVDVYNRALIRLGLSPIAGFGEETDKARTGAIMYPAVRDSALSMHPWRFSTKKGLLNRLLAPPINEWKYAYQLPTDMLSGPYAVFNSDQGGAQTIAEFEIFEDRLLTNEELIIVDYRFRAAEARFNPTFTEFLVYAVAAAVGMILTDNTKLIAEYQERAWGTPSDNMRGGFFAVAMRENAMNNAADAIEANSLVEARFS